MRKFIPLTLPLALLACTPVDTHPPASPTRRRSIVPNKAAKL